MSILIYSSPIDDIKDLSTPIGVKFFDNSLLVSCGQTSSCGQYLRIICSSTGMNPSKEIRRRFYDFYKNQVEMKLVDAFVCFHSASMREVYMPFNRSIIIIASTRHEP